MTQALISSTTLAICSQKISCRSESALMTPAKIVENTTLRLDNRFASPEAVLNSLRMGSNEKWAGKSRLLLRDNSALSGFASREEKQ